MFGWRRRIGYISPTVMELVPYEFYQFAPEGVGLVGVTCNIEDFKVDQYDAGLAAVMDRAKYLGSRHVDYIIHGGAPLVTSRPPGFDLELVKMIEDVAGVPATTAVRAAMDAMTHLGMRRVVLATPYPEVTNQLLTKFIAHYGFEVVHSAWLNVPFKEMQDVPPATIYRFAREAVAKARDADGIYMPCPQWPVWDVVDVIERDVNKPVVCNTNASFFAAFHKLEIQDPIAGFGRLLASLAAS
jgi:maleate cis-trans isomerase